ncbi:hypothetical protein [Achromobacter denitrificans]|uniref:hypothetical protein n=1 Tax=Achromobacter denitrificans TaxID=32002 RepID=UPI003D020F5E
MAVENTTNIAGLDDTLPTGTDTKSEGDNHLRLLKTVLKHVFAGFPGEVLLAATEAQGTTVNDYVLTVAPAPTTYAANTVVVFRANHANTGGATLKIGALAAKVLVNPEGTPLRANAITATTWVLAIYDGTNFRLMGGGNSQAIYDYANQLAFQAALPEQAGHADNLLMTDGTAASWVEYASQTEAEDGMVTNKPMSPLRVLDAIKYRVVQATELIKGILAVATQAQTEAGTSDDVAVTPLKLHSGFSINLAPNGHMKLPSWLGDFQVCWGTPSTAVGGGVAVSFSRAFTVPLGAVATAAAAAVTPVSVVATLSATTGTFYASNQSGGGISISLYYLAFGKG